MIPSNRLYMSSKLSAFSYIHDSWIDYWHINEVTTLSNVIQNIQDHCYIDDSKICLDTIRHRECGKASLWVIIKWLSLWDGKKEIYNRWDIADCVNGVQGRIAVIYEYYGEKRTIDLDDIKDITRSNTIDRIKLIESNEDIASEVMRTVSQVK